MPFPDPSRREFLIASAAAASFPALRAQAEEFHGRLRKAMIVGPVTHSVLAPLKQAGFDGVETRHV
jgi:hypothetical protein